MAEVNVMGTLELSSAQGWIKTTSTMPACFWSPYYHTFLYKYQPVVNETVAREREPIVNYVSQLPLLTILKVRPN